MSAHRKSRFIQIQRLDKNNKYQSETQRTKLITDNIASSIYDNDDEMLSIMIDSNMYYSEHTQFYILLSSLKSTACLKILLQINDYDLFDILYYVMIINLTTAHDLTNSICELTKYTIPDQQLLEVITQCRKYDKNIIHYESYKWRGICGTSFIRYKYNIPLIARLRLIKNKKLFPPEICTQLSTDCILYIHEFNIDIFIFNEYSF